MLKNIVCFLFGVVFLLSCKAQDAGVLTQNETFNNDNPKLVVGIVVDQMRYDYLYAYWDKYSENGFKKLMKN